MHVKVRILMLTLQMFNTKPRKKICVTYPKFVSPAFFSSPNSEVGRFSSNFRIWRKNTYQNEHLKGKSSMHSHVQSLVLEIKGLKQDYIFKNSPFYISYISKQV